MESTTGDLIRALFSTRSGADQRAEALLEIVLDLMVEVEALRRALLASEDDASRDAYRKAYAETAYLLHDASADEALEIAAEAHMSHATGDVEAWIEDNG